MNKKKNTYKLIFIVTAFAVLFGAIALVRLLIYKEPVQYVTVSFETDGGTAVSPVRIVRGTALTAEPFAEKDGFVFVGWCTDEERTEPFRRDTLLDKNTVLYADYVTPKTNSSFYYPSRVFEQDAPVSFSFSITSGARITSLNLSDYIVVEAIYGKAPAMNVTSNGDKYVISPAQDYMHNSLIRFTVCNESVKLSDYGPTASELTVRITPSDDKNDGAHLVPNIKYLSERDLLYKNGSNKFMIPTSLVDSKKIAAGDIICLGDGTDVITEGVVFSTVNDISRQNSVCIITTKDCLLNDIAENFTENFEEVISMPEFLAVSPSLLQMNAESSTAAIVFADVISTLANENSEVPTESGAENEPSAPPETTSPFTKPETVTSWEQDIKALIDGLTVTATVGEAKVGDFDKMGIDDENWLVIHLAYNYKATLSNGKEVDANIASSFYFKVILKGTLISNDEKEMLNCFADIYTRTDLALKVICDGIDISEEINGIFEDDSKISSDDVLARLKNTLKNKEEALELCNTPLLKGNMSLIEDLPIFDVNFDLDYCLSINLADGFMTSTEMTVLDSAEVGFTADTETGTLDTYLTSLSNDIDSFYINSDTSGYMGIRSGINSTISVSSTAVKKLGTVGATFESGIYADVYGYASILAESVDEVFSETKGVTYTEIGDYVSVSTFTDSEYFENHVNTDTYTGYKLKSPLFKTGSKRALLSLDDEKRTYISNSGSAADFANLPLFTGTYIDLITGEEIKGDFVPRDELVIKFSNPYFVFDSETGEVTIKDQLFGSFDDGITQSSNLVTCEMDVYYVGTNLFPSVEAKTEDAENEEDEEPEQSTRQRYSTLEDIAAAKYFRREISSLIWLREGYDLHSTAGKKTVKATFKIDTGDELITIGEREVISGEAVGAFDISALLEYYTPTTGWNKQPDDTRINYDTVFTFHAIKKQTVVAFVYFNGVDWVAEVKACDLGSMPTPPEGSETGYGDMDFTGWRVINGRNVSNPEIKMYKGIREIECDLFGKTLEGERLGIVYGYDTENIVEHTEGAKNEVLTAIYESAVNMGAGCYIAEYSDNTYPVTFEYKDDNGVITKKTHNIPFGFDATGYARIIENIYSTFEGWDVDGDGEVDYGRGEYLPAVTGEQTIRAIYRSSDVNVYTYSYSQDGTYGNKLCHTVPSGSYTGSVLENITPTVPPTADGESYEFLYWECSWDDEVWYATENVASLRLSSDIFLRPVFRRYVEITFDAGEGTIGGRPTVTKRVPSGISISFSQLGIDTPTAEGDEYYSYTATGWKNEANGKVYALNATIIVDSPVKFTAVFLKEMRQYTITIRTDHSSIYGSTKQELEFNVTYEEAQPIAGIYITNLPENVDEDGFFWRCTGVKTADTNEGLLITYTWEKLIRITFEANGGAFEDESNTYSLLLSPDNAVLSLETLSLPSREDGAALLGFSDEEGTFYTVADVVEATENLTLTAVWQSPDEIVHKVTFDAGSGLFENGSRYFVMYVRDGAPIAALPSSPTDDTVYEGDKIKIFSSWNIPTPAAITEDITFVAQYTEKPRLYSVTYYVDGVLYDQTEYALNEAILVLAAPTEEGKTFSGWVWYDGDVALSAPPSVMDGKNYRVEGSFN